MSAATSTNNQNNDTSRYTNKDQGKGFALFGYIVLAIGVIAAIILVILFGIPGYFYA